MSVLVDRYGRPIPKKQDRPIFREIAAVSLIDRYSSYPSHGLTPERLAQIFKEADQGMILRQVELFEEMEEKDPHLGSILQTRRMAVLGLDWEIKPYDENEPADRAVADFVRTQLENLEGLEDNLLDLLDAIGKGFAVCEIMWGVEAGRVVVRELRWRHQKKFDFDEYDRLRYLPEGSGVGRPIPPNKFVVHRYKARSGISPRAGVLRTCAWMYLFKNYSVKDWVSFAEVYGIPMRVGTYEPSASQEDKEALMRALVQLGSDAAGIIPSSAKIEFPSVAAGATASGQSIFQALATFADNQMSKAVLGQTLTTDVGDVGSYAASKTHEGVRQDLLEADCKALAETLRRYLIRPLVLFNFGEAACRRLPWWKFAYEQPEDQQHMATVYTSLARDMGLPISQAHIYERFGVPKPKAGEELLQPPTASPFAFTAHRAAPAATLPERPPGRRQAQAAIDSLADRATQEATALFEGLLEPVRRMIAEASDLEDLRRRLLSSDLVEQMDTSEVEDLIGRALYVADLWGRWSVDGD